MSRLEFVKEAYREHKKLAILAFILSLNAAIAFPLVYAYLIARKKKKQEVEKK